MFAVNLIHGRPVPLVLAVHHHLQLGVGADDRKRRFQLVAGVGDEFLLILRIADFGTDGDFGKNPHHNQRKKRAEDAQRQCDVADAADIRKLVFNVHEHQRRGISRRFGFKGVISHLTALRVSRLGFDKFRNRNRVALVHLVEVQHLDRFVIQIDYREVTHRIHYLTA